VGQWRPSPGPQVDQSFEPAINPQLIAEFRFETLEDEGDGAEAVFLNRRVD
jgi:hypothetical protein